MTPEERAMKEAEQVATHSDQCDYIYDYMTQKTTYSCDCILRVAKALLTARAEAWDEGRQSAPCDPMPELNPYRAIKKEAK